MLTLRAAHTFRRAAPTSDPDTFAEIFGDVLIYNNDVRLQADSAQLSFVDNQITLNHNISIIDTNLCIKGTRASGNFLVGQGSVEQAQFIQPQSNLRGSAAEISLNGRQRFELSEGVVTRCPGDADFWRISSQALVADQAESALTVKNMVLRVKDVPSFVPPLSKNTRHDRAPERLFAHRVVSE